MVDSNTNHCDHPECHDEHGHSDYCLEDNEGRIQQEPDIYDNLTNCFLSEIPECDTTKDHWEQ